MPDTARPAAALPADLDATLAPWRACAASRAARVRLRLVESLARRAATLEGDARRLVDDRLATLLAGLAGLAANDPEAPAPDSSAPQPRSALATLLGDLAHRPSTTARPAAPPQVAPAGRAQPASPPPLPALGSDAEPEALQYFRRTWSRLSADQRLAQSRSALPGNAGPLHSQQLVHRSLMLMREVAPEYLERFVSHVDALLWLDHANAAMAADATTAARPPTERRAQAATRTPRVARTKADPQA